MIEPAFLAALNHLLEGADWARARLRAFAGRRARIEMPPLAFGFAIAADGRVEPCQEGEASDVVVRLPAETPFLLARGLDKVMAGAGVEGNAEFATELSFVLRHLRWDVEEDLARRLGDVAAHRLVGLAGRLLAWRKQAGTRLAENLGEYLTRERPMLVGADEFAAWRDAVVRFDNDLTRVERRLDVARRASPPATTR